MSQATLPISGIAPDRRKKPLLAGSLLIVLMLGLAWLIYRPAALERLFPRCMFHQLTGLYCPGCGGTRALHSLLHGHWLDALHNNPFTTIALPWILWIVLQAIWRIAMGMPPANRATLLPMWLVLGIAMGLTAFMILRNIPLECFDFLRPIG